MSTTGFEPAADKQGTLGTLGALALSYIAQSNTLRKRLSSS